MSNEKKQSKKKIGPKQTVPKTSVLNDLDPVLQDSFSGTDVSKDITFDLNNIDNEKNSKVAVKNIAYAQSNPDQKVSSSLPSSFINQVEVSASVQLGQAKIKLKELQNLTEGSLIELDRYVGEPVELVVNNKVFAQGEVVSVNNKFGLKIKSIEDQ